MLHCMLQPGTVLGTGCQALPVGGCLPQCRWTQPVSLWLQGSEGLGRVWRSGQRDSCPLAGFVRLLLVHALLYFASGLPRSCVSTQRPSGFHKEQEPEAAMRALQICPDMTVMEATLPKPFSVCGCQHKSYSPGLGVPVPFKVGPVGVWLESFCQAPSSY